VLCRIGGKVRLFFCSCSCSVLYGPELTAEYLYSPSMLAPSSHYMQSIGRDNLDGLQLIIQTRHATKPRKRQCRLGVLQCTSNFIRGKGSSSADSIRRIYGRGDRPMTLQRRICDRQIRQTTDADGLRLSFAPHDARFATLSHWCPMNPIRSR
jgi:hypothetical protein